MMNSGVTTYRVVGASAQELLGRLIDTVKTQEPAEFTAINVDDPSLSPAEHQFRVEVQKLLFDAIPVAAEVLDQNRHWFQLILHKDAPIEFDIITT